MDNDLSFFAQRFEVLGDCSHIYLQFYAFSEEMVPYDNSLRFSFRKSDGQDIKIRADDSALVGLVECSSLPHSGIMFAEKR